MQKKGRDDFDRSAQPQARWRKMSHDAPFEYWLDRELWLLRRALSEPVRPDLIEIIRRHKKITR